MTSINSISKSLKSDIAFVGLAHLGLVFSICASSLKLNVLAIDKDSFLVSKLSKGTVDIPEPGLQKLLLKNKGRINFSTNIRLLSEPPLIFISLDTPLNKPLNLTKLNLLIDKIIPFLIDDQILVVVSQVPVGFTRKLSKKIITKRPKLKFNLYYFLNTLIIGNSVNRFLKPERIVIGKNETKTPINPLLKKFLGKFNCPIFEMSYESAELTKSAINLYLTSSIITTNTLADFCEKIGADINEIIPALKSDRRIGPYAYLKPALRISGGHLERELVKLKKLGRQYKIKNGIIEPLIKLNENRIKWLIQKINKQLPAGKIKQVITLWGLSYKKNTESTENAASIEIIKKLSKKFNFQVYDPKAKMPKNILGYRRFKEKYLALKDSELLIILTDWDEFNYIEEKKVLKLMSKPSIIDCVGVIRKEIAGANISCMGKASQFY